MFQDILKEQTAKLNQLKELLVLDRSGKSQVKLTASSRKQIEEQINETYDRIRKFEEFDSSKYIR